MNKKSSQTIFVCSNCGVSYPIRKDHMARRQTTLCKSCRVILRNKSPEGRKASSRVGRYTRTESICRKSSESRKNFYQLNGTEIISGSKNPSWRGGTTYLKGYRLVCVPGHPRATRKGHYVFEHILVMEAFLGRYLKDDEIVHHINKIVTDNRIENLRVMTKSEHSSLHQKERWAKRCQE